MGLFEKIFGRQEKIRANETFELLNGYVPAFTSWRGSIYEADLVRSAIDARARHSGKLKLTIQGSAKPKLATKLKQKPNEMQTWSQFLYLTSTILDVNNTCFIVPVIDRYGETTGIYPIIPQSWELVNTKSDVIYIRFYFVDGRCAAFKLSEVGILTKFQYSSEFFGEDNRALIPAMELIHIQRQGIKEGVKNGASFRFMATLSNFSNDEDLKKERNRFAQEQMNGGGGLLLFKNTYKDIKQIESKPFLVDEPQMKMINEKVNNYFGVNSDVLQNRAYGDAWSAFYEGAIEPFAIQLSDVMTKMLYTETEISHGAGIMFTSNRLQYMSTNDKLEVSAQLSDRGILNRDEVREIWNLPPLPNGEGENYIIRGEYYNANEKINEGDSNGEGN